MTARDVDQMSRRDLVSLVTDLQALLWLDSRMDGNGKEITYWNPDKEWDRDILGSIVDLAVLYKLDPKPDPDA